jgi:hypothetical protein
LIIVAATQGRSPRLQPWKDKTKAEALDSKRRPLARTIIKAEHAVKAKPLIICVHLRSFAAKLFFLGSIAA